MPTRTAMVARMHRALSKTDLDALSDRDLLARFTAEGDQAAFASVVARHAPMVLGVCRRSLARSGDPEDACQAVFLLLARKAANTRWQASAAGWLYTAARKVARNARLAAERRTRWESRAAAPESMPFADTISGRELAAILDEELDRLPPRYRDPLVLCYYEGLTQDEAAARLGVPEGTLKSQLQRGRRKLANALTARGWEPGVVLLAAAATSATATARLHDSIIAAATGSPSDAAIALAGGVDMGGFTVRTKAVLMAAAGIAAVLGLGIASAPPTAAQPRKSEQPTIEKPNETAEGRIIGSRFRADAPVGDARYSAAGKRVVGCAGSSIYVWDAGDGKRLRTIPTGLALLDDPTRHGEMRLAFAVHPEKNQVACGGVKDGKTVLQVWDTETGKRIAEKASECDALKALAWTPDGKRLLERANAGWERPTAWKLIVRDETLGEVRSHDLPREFGEWSTVMHPLPGSKEAILWQSRTSPTVFDLDSGEAVRTIDYKLGIPSGLGISPDGKTLAMTSTEDLRLIDFIGGELRHKLPVLRSSWDKPRPLFSPDGTTVIVWDHRPIAYDTTSGKEVWRAAFRTTHASRMMLCDVSPDGATVLVRHGHALARVDARTGTERDPPEAPSLPAELTWSLDGRTLFTRTEGHDRTWTAWDASGRRLYDLLPTGFVADGNWKMLPQFFFLKGGKELVAGIEKAESNEQSGAKELFIFDTSSGQCLRRFGDPLPLEEFRWRHPIGVAPDGSNVLMQTYTVSARAGVNPAMFDPNPEYHFDAVRWDPVKNAKLQEWTVFGNRHTPSRHFAPYAVTEVTNMPDLNAPGQKANRAKVRFYSLADGRLMHELHTDFGVVGLDRVQGNFVLTAGYESKWVKRGNSIRYTPQPPYAFDLWDLPSRAKVRLFELNTYSPVVLGSGGRYVIRVLNDNSFEIHEPFVLKKSVVTVASPGRPERFEFSPDGSRVAASLADASIAVWETASWLKRIDEQIAREAPTDLAPLWDDLAKEPAVGLRAARLLGAAGDRAVALLNGKIEAKKPADGAAVKKLVDDLGSPEFDTREKAEKELGKLSTQAESELREALRTNPSPEVMKRAGNLLRGIASLRLTAAEIREVRAVQSLDWMNSNAARALLAKWAKGDRNAPLTKAAVEAIGRWGRDTTRDEPAR